MVRVSISDVQVSDRGDFARLLKKKGGEYYSVFGGGFPIAHFKSLSKAREVAAQRRKYLSFNLKKNRDSLYKQKGR